MTIILRGKPAAVEAGPSRAIPAAAGAAKPGFDEQQLGRLAGLFRLLSDPTRLRLLGLLAGGERHVTGLCDVLGLPQPTVSHHLGLLRSGGLLAARRAGKQVFYFLDGRVSAPASPARPASPDGPALTFAPGDGIEVRVDHSGLASAAD